MWTSWWTGWPRGSAGGASSATCRRIRTSPSMPRSPFLRRNIPTGRLHGLRRFRTSRRSRPLRLFARPEAIDVTADFPDGAPAQFRWRRNLHVIVRTEGPERIAMEWWRHRDETTTRRTRIREAASAAAGHRCLKRDGSVLTRDYFRAEDRQGVRYWIYREGIFAREVRDFRWFLHGLFA